MLKLMRYLKPYWIPVSAVVVVVFLQSMGDLYLPTLMSNIVNKGITNGDIPYILSTGLEMILVAIGGSICAVIASYLSSHVAMGFGEDLRSGIFSRVSRFSLHEFDRFGTPSLVTRSTNDVVQVQNIVMMTQRMMIAAPITAVGGMILALQKDKGLAWIIIVAIPVLGIFIGTVAAKGFPLFQAIQKKIDRINLVVRENLTGIRVIRAFNRGEYEKKRFNEASYDLLVASVKVNRIFAMMMPVMMLIMNMTVISILWFGSHRIDSGVSNIGNMMAFLQYAMQILFSFVMASIMFIMVPRAQASADRINEVLDTQPDLVDPTHPNTPDSSVRGYLEFRDVRFSYFGAEAPALQNISFVAKPGETTAIIGSTGSGKSTLVSLIPRFYDVASGQILVDGVDIRDMTQKDLRSRIGFVPQKAVLFTGSVSENIRYGKDDATEEEVLHAAEVSQSLDFVTAMDKGFDSLISQGGTNVSGGQKQRLSIARALVKKPEIYVFDDSFSALDFKTDSLLRAALHKETGNATVIIVGQRVATIMDSDRIIVLDEGRIAGMGTHHELYASCPVYREIVESQLSEEEIA
jgi:ATP-binding cassette subfamily B protein